MITDIEFTSARTTIRGRLYTPSPHKANGAGVVLAHGLAGTMDSGIPAYAEAFAKVGFHALTFDYRGFGASGGTPRQLVSVPYQREDWRQAINALRRHDNVDADRIGLWGVSLSGGHVIHLAHDDPKIHAIVAQVPIIDPILSCHVGHYHRGPSKTNALRRDIATHFRRRWFFKKVDMVPVVPDGSNRPAMLEAPEAEMYPQLAGPDWRNEIHPESFFVGKFHTNNPSLLSDDMKTPLLLQMSQQDKIVSNEAIVNFARRCGPMARLTRFDGNHFTLLQDNSKRKQAIADAVSFYQKHLFL